MKNSSHSPTLHFLLSESNHLQFFSVFSLSSLCCHVLIFLERTDYSLISKLEDGDAALTTTPAFPGKGPTHLLLGLDRDSHQHLHGRVHRSSWPE